ncbi:carbohydrate esterase family 4 protein [Stipitochalara longipes BDJ]|nr:carbohydrate esterase family 4 protein [Stipitochalara longipes BDJ]
MKYTTLVAAALASTASAHSDPRDAHSGIPKMLGGRKFLAELRAKNALPAALMMEKREEKREPNVHVMRSVEDLEERQISTNGQCGPGLGHCPTGQCCSIEGWCGNGIDYCAAPDCQFLYGTGCDANTVPAGASTAGIARPQLGSIPYGGAGIYDCIVPGDIAFTFDDGPYNYTSDLLDKLAVYNASATFMITGNNLGKGPIDTTPQWSNVIKRMIASGHQIASHTWSHQNLTSLDPTYFNQQIIYNEMAFNNILGYFPTYMRPPYSECNATCGALLGKLGYHVTYFDLDTEGYLNDDPTLIQNSKNIWDAAINPSNPATDNFLEIEHDIHYQTVYNLTDYILASMYKHGYKSVTVGQCLGDPAANWYRSGNPNAPVPQSVSTDGTCSASITCYGSTFGNCCSSAGWCGSTSAYCGTGCQPASGNCTSTSTTSVKSTTSTKATTSSTKVTTTSSTVKTSSSTIKTTSNTSKTTSSKTSSTSTASQAISTDGTCGTTITCIGSTFGNCCSQYGYCGSTSGYCGTGCNPVGGTCGSGSSSSSSKKTSTSSSKIASSSTSTKATTSSTKATTTSTKATTTSTKTSASPTSTKKVSTDGTCAGTEGFTCQGSTYGNCCSQYSWCGSTSAYCLTSNGCQSGFGTCT